MVNRKYNPSAQQAKEYSMQRPTLQASKHLTDRLDRSLNRITASILLRFLTSETRDIQRTFHMPGITFQYYLKFTIGESVHCMLIINSSTPQLLSSMQSKE